MSGSRVFTFPLEAETPAYGAGTGSENVSPSQNAPAEATEITGQSQGEEAQAMLPPAFVRIYPAEGAPTPTGNAPTLTMAVAQIRNRLARLAGSEAPPIPDLPVIVPGGCFGPLTLFRPRLTDAERQEMKRQWEAPLTQWRSDWETYAQGLKSQDVSLVPEPLRDLIDRKQLNEFEARLILLCVAAEMEPATGLLCGQALQRRHNCGFYNYPTLAVAQECFPGYEVEAQEALLPHRPLDRLKLLTINEPSVTPLSLAGLTCHSRISGMLREISQRDEIFTRFCHPLPTVADVDADALLGSEETALAQAQSLLNKVNAVALVGPNAAGQHRVAARLACSSLPTGAPSLAALTAPKAFSLSLSEFPKSDEDREVLLVVLERELVLDPFLLVLDAHGDTAPNAFYVRRLLELPGKIVLLAPDTIPQTPVIQIVRVGPPPPNELKEAWRQALPAEDFKVYAAQLAGQFRLSADDIRVIARELPAREGLSTPDSELKRKRILWDACKQRTRPRMEGLAQRIEPRATWDDLVLPEAEEALLRQIVAQAQARYSVYYDMGYAARKSHGLGISVLFHGESGTGKTLAAEVVASALMLDLYRIDLSAVVDKYIGETEKNLRRLFDAAEEGGAILLFDEADAVFSKRGEVKDSHDRYANIEVNYLLQRMETYTGIGILTTNRKNDLDKAFMRRLRFIVPFPLPEPTQRKRIWAASLPKETAGGQRILVEKPEWSVGKAALTWDEAFTRLSLLKVTGAVIDNIARGAMFRAASLERAANTAGCVPQVDLYHIGEAAREEFRKMERSIPEMDLPALRPVAQSQSGYATKLPTEVGENI